MKTRAEKKIQIAIDKLIDLQQDICTDNNGYIERCLENLRSLESKIYAGKVKNGYLNI